MNVSVLARESLIVYRYRPLGGIFCDDTNRSYDSRGNRTDSSTATPARVSDASSG